MKPKEKVDLYKSHKDEYAAPRTPALLNVKPAVYLAVGGQGEPGGELFSDRIGALYAAAYTVKMARKFAGKRDYSVCKLEAQWWCDGHPDFASGPKDRWCWKLLIRTPEFVKPDELDKAAAVLLKRGKGDSVKEVRLESLDEGRCVQMLHVGPYERERETVDLMKAHAERNGLTFHGRHHEIYLSDPRRVPAARLKTLLRHPVRP